MSQSSNYSANPETKSVIPCSKCNTRHHYEELSSSQQLCKDCRISHQLVKCNYCRTEYHQDSSNNGNGTANKHTNRICTKCQSLEAQHGKPGPCAYCNIIAAFIGTKCQRCTNSEKKYGQPLVCDHCRQKCAFDRKDPESKKKVDNKLLCWLCTMAYKRTLARARQKEAAKLTGSKYEKSDKASIRHHSHHRHQHHNPSSRHHQGSSNNSVNEDLYQRSSGDDLRHLSGRHRESTSSSSIKKQRVENSTNSVPSRTMSSTTEGRFAEPSITNDMTAVVSQLKEQVSTLTKRLQMKDKDLLAKDQQIAELRATITREQRETKEKLQSLQKQHVDRMGELQTRIITMQKQMVSQSKAARTSATTTTIVEPPLVI